MTQILHYFLRFKFDILLTVLVVFCFFSFLFFLLGDYLIKIDDIFCKISSIQSPLRYLDIPYSVLHSPLS